MSTISTECAGRRSPALATDAETYDALMARSEHCRQVGDHSTGRECAKKAAAIALAEGDEHRHADALSRISVHSARLSELEQAVRAGKEALRIYESVDDMLGASRTNAILAYAFFLADLLSEAAAHGIEAQRQALACGDAQAQRWASLRLSMVYDGMGQIETAIGFAQRALAGARQCGDAETLFAALNNLAEIYYDNWVDEPVDKPGREEALELAVARAREALAVARAGRNPHRETYALNSLARPLMALGRHEEAAQVLQLARTIADTNGYRFLYVSALLLVARGFRLSGRPTEAIEAYRSVIAARDLEVTLEGEAHQALYELFKERGEFELALSHHEKFHSLRTSELTARADWQGKLLMVKYELEAAQQQARRAQLEAEMQRVRADQLDQTAHTDPLTGAYNRRFFEAHLPRLLQRAAERSLPLSAAMLDVDYFKRINDRFGHAAGDRVLIALCKVVTSIVRGSDILVRVGGEEFLVLFVDTPLHVASGVCERLRHQVESHPWQEIEPALQVAVSSGVAVWDGAESATDWIARIDAALYRAKSGGRNRVVVAD